MRFLAGRRLAVLLLGMVLSAACSLGAGAGAATSPAATAEPAPLTTPSTAPSPSPESTPTPIPGPMIASGDPSALPGILLISDRGNSRLIEIDGRGTIRWQFPPPGYKGEIPFDRPDDAFYSPDQSRISTNQEFENTVQVIDRLSSRVVWSHGVPYQAGAGAGYLNGPDDAFLLADGRLVTADIKNCRILVLTEAGVQGQIGHTGVCRHDPAHGYLASPNGDAPDSSGEHLIVTEIGGSWIDSYHLPDLGFEYSVHSPAQYASDATLQPDGSFILADYIAHGAVYRIDHEGKVLWKYDQDLNHPSIAIALPNRLVAIADDYGARVVIVDPATNQIRWQYGVKNQPGAGPGHLSVPDGLDFRPDR